MTFHPEALDLAQLKTLSKQMKRGSASVLPNNPLSLSQCQELLARTLGYDNWHAANKAREPKNKASTITNTNDVLLKSVDDMLVYERILLGAFMAAESGDIDNAHKAFRALHLASENEVDMLYKKAVTLDKYTEQIREAINISLSYPGNELNKIEKKTTSVNVLARALEKAREKSILASANFLWLKTKNKKMWQVLCMVGRQVKSDKHDPFMSVDARVDLIQEIILLMGLGMEVAEALDRIAEINKEHGQFEIANALYDEWLPGIEKSVSWQKFLVEKLRDYNPKAALRFDMMTRQKVVESKMKAFQQLLKDMEHESENDRISKHAIGRTFVVNNHPR